MKRAGSKVALNHRCRIDTVCSMHKFAISPMKLPPGIVYFLIFDEFHRHSATNRHQSIDYFQFLWASEPNCRRSIFLAEDDDRSAYRHNQEYFNRDSSVIDVYKKLLFHR